MQKRGSMTTQALSSLLEALGLSPIDEASESMFTEESNGGLPSLYSDHDVFPERTITPFAEVEIPFGDEDYEGDFYSDFQVDIWSDFEEEDTSADAHGFDPSSFQRPESSLLGNFDIASTTPTPVTFSPPLSPAFSTSTSISDHWVHLEQRIHVKAAFNAIIIVLRAPRSITLSDVKRRLSEKFARQEDIFLSTSFSVIFVSPSVASSSTPTNKRSKRVSIADRTEMRFIDSEDDWRWTVASHTAGEKITLRILDTPL